ncbi:Protein dead ringer [Amphibalanus amphitrite]|uniref:Protein dead ringer n=1 Tax=Amphibalanus amphitrite TaxID=1232801 RepID=A0A6A4VTD2_AMPAM|nr:Protein dead ringer [Amphibalanus amphitrite]
MDSYTTTTQDIELHHLGSYVVGQYTDPRLDMAKESAFKINRTLTDITKSTTLRITPQHKCILIKTSNETQTKALLSATTFANHDASFTLHRTLNTTRATIRTNPLDTPLAVIGDELASQGVSSIRRLASTHHYTILQLTFNTTILPPHLYEIDDNPKRKEFLDELFRFMQNRGTPINRLPIMAKQVLDLYELYNLVVARGGLVEVINKKLWQEIIKGLKLPSSITSAAFTLRTQYMKYLYPQECQKEGLSSPSELQAAVDGNRREGRRSSYTNNSYADFVQRSPLLSGQMAPSFGLGNGMPMPTSLHQQGLSPLSLVTSRPAAPGSNGPAGHPMPPSSPFLPAMGGPVMPSANDTLMTLWSLYNRQQQQQQPPSPPGRRPEPPPPAAPQSEALNLGVRREMARQEREREQQEREREQLERDRSRELELHRERELELEREREREMKREMPENMSPPNKRAKSEEGDNKMESMPHTKMSISSKADGSLVLSMELNGVVYQGILFAQPSPGR